MHEERDVFSSMSALMDKNSTKEFDAATTHGVFFSKTDLSAHAILLTNG